MSADTVVKTVLHGTGQREWVVENVDRLKADGFVFFRVSHPLDKPDELYLEGWRARPEEQGPHPWEMGT